MMEDVQGSASVRATRPTTIWEGTVSDMEKFLMNLLKITTEAKKQKWLFARLKEKFELADSDEHASSSK